MCIGTDWYYETSPMKLDEHALWRNIYISCKNDVREMSLTGQGEVGAYIPVFGPAVCECDTI